MCKFSKRELEVLRLQKEIKEEGAGTAKGRSLDIVIAAQLGIKDPKQVAVHRSNARRKIVRARRFYQDGMKEYGVILFPGVHKKYKEVK